MIALFTQSPSYRFSNSEDCYILAVLFFIFPTTDFSTSLGRFLRNFATRRDVSSNILSPLWVFISYVIAENLMDEKPQFCRFADPKSTVSATPFHNAREIWKSKTVVSVYGSVASGGRPHRTWWGSHPPSLRSVVPLGSGVGKVNFESI